MLTPEERQWAQARLADIPQPHIVIHPGGLSARHWQMRHHWDLAKQFLAKAMG
jgi:hypothetical protein